MAATSTLEESFASSSSLPPRTYDVFLSFRGEDTRMNFIDHLYSVLVRHGFYTFRDENKLERGEEIGPELLKTIEGSRLSVIIFSRNYVASRWCLDELVKILECKSTFQQMVLPVFYHVDPSDVRAQRGSFAKTFARHEERYKSVGMEGKVERWRVALTEAANLSGWHLQNVADWHESKFIEMIVEDISNKIDLPYLNVANYPVGIEPRVQRVNMLLSLGSDNVRMVGICGIGGIGKTTIAKAVYNLIRLKFEGSSFLANIRETSKQPNGLVGLQEQLLSDILMNENQNITNVDQGIEVIKQRLWCRRVLVVLDDVDGIEQLKALAIRRDWFHSGSRIIVTTRDESLLEFLEVDGKYMPELLSYDESLQLFSRHAFRKYHPIEDNEELLREVLVYAGGLPFVLEVLGSFFKGTSVPEWKSALESLKVTPHYHIQSKLRISFDSLDDKEKNLFLDIACFFVGMDQNYIIKILEGCGFFPEYGIGVLSRRCLVEIDIPNQLIMHGMLRDMGREIVREEYPNEPGKRSRLWFHEDVLDVLTNHTGTEAVEGLVLNLPRSNDVLVNTQAFAKMNNLRLLKLHNVSLSGSYEHLSKRLSWLYWFGCPLKSIPSNFFMEKVVAIDMPYSSLKRVWKGRKILNKLKFLNLSHSSHLTKTPDFSGATGLETLLLNDCIRLVDVHQSIECLDKLVVLDLKNCKRLRKLPQGIWKLTSLQNLSLCGCSELEKLPVFEGSPSVVRNPDSISHLNLKNCNLSYVPDELGSLTKLKVLDLQGNDFHTLPASISHLSRLRSLHLDYCRSLQSLPKLPVNLEKVVARNCTSLERISIGSDFRKSPSLTFTGCHKLVQNNIVSKFRKNLLQNQELSAVGDFSIIIPGSEVPYFFNYQSEGSVLSFVVSLRPNQKIRGWILCVVIANHIDERFNESADGFLSYGYKVKNKTKGLEMPYHRILLEDLLNRQDRMWLHYAPQHCHDLHMENGDVVVYSIFFNSGYTQPKVKECGVYLIYEKKDYLSNDQAMIQHASLSYHDVILDKDVLADQAVANNKKFRHSYVGLEHPHSKLETPLGFKGSPSKSRFSILSPQASPARNPDSISFLRGSTPGLISIRKLDMAGESMERGLKAFKERDFTHEAASKSSLRMTEISDITHETTSKFSSRMTEVPNDTFGAASQSPDERIDTSSSQDISKHPSSLVRVEISDISQLNDLPTSLHSLKIEECDALKFLSEEMMDNLPCLEQLYIISCRSLESFPSGGLPTTLKTLSICNCRKLQFPLPAKMVHQYALLERLCIESSCDSLKSFSLGYFPKLISLSLWGFAKLESISIPDELHVDLNSLDVLEIRDCPKLVFFPKGGLPAPKLTSIWISNCKNLEALPERMHTLLPSLQVLSISKCPNLVLLPDGGLASLTHFEIEGECSSVESFPKEGLLPTSLTSLRISGLSNFKYLDCNGLRHLTSLETLEINCCDKLQSFPVEDLPTSLSFLIIKECSLLKIRCQSDEGVDWPMKARIPHVEIDEEVISSACLDEPL